MGIFGQDTKAEQIAVSIPPIVTRETWKVVQARLIENRRRADSRRKNNYLMGGRVTCGDCGLKMRGSANGRAGAPGTRAYYTCTGRTQKLGTARECNAPTFRADYVDEAVWENVKSFFSDPEVLERGLEETQKERERENAPMRARLEAVDHLLEEKQVSLGRLLDLYISGEFDRRMLEDRKARLEAEIAGLVRERAALISRLEAQTLSDEQIESLKMIAERTAKGLVAMDDDFAARRRLIEQLDARITLTARGDIREIHISYLIVEDRVDVSHSTGKRVRQRMAAKVDPALIHRKLGLWRTVW